LILIWDLQAIRKGLQKYGLDWDEPVRPEEVESPTKRFRMDDGYCYSQRRHAVRVGKILSMD
jgi:hypothetical protein